MKTGTIIAILAGIVVLGGGVYFFMSDSGEPRGDAWKASEEADREGRTGMGSLKNLLSFGDDVTCDISYTDETGGEMAGVVFVSEGNFRGDFLMRFEGQEMETHVIQDGEYGYSWSMSPFGMMAIRFAIEDHDDASSETDTDGQGAVDLEQEVEYECRPWRVDGSKFVPPDDVQFTDMSVQAEQTQNASFNLEGDQCAACSQIPNADAKAQCLAALSCN